MENYTKSKTKQNKKRSNQDFFSHKIKTTISQQQKKRKKNQIKKAAN